MQVLPIMFLNASLYLHALWLLLPVLLFSCAGSTHAAVFSAQNPEISQQQAASLKSALLQAKLLPTPAGIAGTSGRFGYAVSLDNNRALVSGIGLGEKGAAVVLEKSGTGWTTTAILRPTLEANYNQFGAAVSLSGNRALIGVWQSNENGNEAGSAYIFDFDGTRWNQTAQLLASDGAAADHFGISVSLQGDRAVIGANQDDDLGSNSGSAYVFEFDGSNWSQTSKLHATDGSAVDYFGEALSLSGDRVLIAARRDSVAGTYSGSAYVFDYDGSQWVQTAKLLPNDGAAYDAFGQSVSLSGNRALIGASEDDDQGTSSGSAYIFDFDGTNWSQTAKLLPSDGSASANFGISVSLSSNRALVGAHVAGAGAAYVFDFDGSAWAQTSKLVASGVSSPDRFGFSVSLDGDSALIGAERADDFGNDGGAAYLFAFDGSAWSQTSKLLPDEGATGDNFGFSLSIHGNQALVGAQHDGENGTYSGAAYLFVYDGNQWNLLTKLLPTDGAAYDQFGYAVSLGENRAFIGADGDDDLGTNSGAVYLFEPGSNGWTQTAKLLAADAATGDRFGTAISQSGNRVLIGSYLDDDLGTDSGSAYLFDWNGSQWSQSAKLLPIDGSGGERFGIAVSLSGTRALIGASGDNDYGSNSGSAHVFDFDGSNWNPSARLIASSGASSDFFGFSVSLEGNRALVGAHGNDWLTVSAGAAFVFEFDGSTWNQTATLLAADGGVGDHLGYSVNLAGNLALLGSYLHDGNGQVAGAAYLFQLKDGNWSQINKILPLDTAAGDKLGQAVSLSPRHALLGVPFDDIHGTDSGSVYVYEVNRPPVAQDDNLITLEDQPLSVSLFSDNGNGMDIDPDGDAFVVQSPGSFTAEGIGGTVSISSDGQLLYTPPSDLSGMASFSYSIADPAGASDTASVSITIDPVNDRPTFTAQGTTTVLEDAGPQVVSNWSNFSAGGLNEAQTALAYTLSNISNPMLFSSIPTVDANGTLRFTPALDQFGTSTFDVVVQDDGGTANGGVDLSSTQTFTISITPVNDPPTFTPGSSVTVIEDSSYSQAWASGITPGPSNENNQTLSWITTVTSNPGLFSVAPAIDASGVLSFVPAQDINGSATVQVMAVDDGGTANGGGNQSAPFDFSIDVIAAADLSISKYSNAFFAQAGGPVHYTITAYNAGPSDISQAMVVDQPPARLGNVSWTCTPDPGASCAASGTGPINESVDLPQGTGVSFQLDAVLMDSLHEPLTNAASITAPPSVMELAPANNSDSDTDRIGLFADSMESVEP